MVEREFSKLHTRVRFPSPAPFSPAPRLVSVYRHDPLGLRGTGPNGNFTVDAVPEPSTWIMALAGIAGLGVAAWGARRARRFQSRDPRCRGSQFVPPTTVLADVATPAKAEI